VIVITTGWGRAKVHFNYNERALEVIRTIPGRRWHPDSKTWSIPGDMTSLTAGEFARAGFRVSLNDELFKPRAHLSSDRDATNVFAALMEGIPKRLREPVFRALTKVLHPDHDGDTELMKQLNAARPARPVRR
jgi:hypothetical protein